MSENGTPVHPADESPGQIVQVYTWRSALVKSLDCHTCKLVALVLSLHMNEMGGSAFPSNRTLADECSLGISTVREHLNGHLHAHGWLTLIERGGTKGGVNRANSWQALIPIDPRQMLADPRQQDAYPRQQTATPPPGAGSQVSIELDHEQNAGRSHRCSACGNALPTLDALCDHQEKDCDALKTGDVSLKDAREELKKSGGRGVPIPDDLADDPDFIPASELRAVK